MTRRFFNLASLQPLLILSIFAAVIGDAKTGEKGIVRTGENDIGRTSEHDIGRTSESDIERTDKLDIGLTSDNDIGRTGENDIGRTGENDIGRTNDNNIGIIRENGIVRTNRNYIGSDAENNIPIAGLNDITDGLLNNNQYAVIDGKPEFSESVLSPKEGGYLPGEGTIQHYAHVDTSWPVQYGSSLPFDTPLQFDMIMRSKRSMRKKKLDANGLQKIVMASLLPENDTKLFSIKKVRSAIELAIEKMNPLLVHHNRTLVVKFRDSKCDIAEGMNELINFYIHDEIDVLLGPCCDYAIAPCARQVPFWNIPLLTAGGIAADFGTYKNSTFYTMTRLGPNFQQLTKMLVRILNQYRWNKIRLIYEPTGERNVSNKHCYLATNDIHYGIMFSEDARGVKQDYKKFERREEMLENMEEFLSIDVAIHWLSSKLVKRSLPYHQYGYKQNIF